MGGAKTLTDARFLPTHPPPPNSIASLSRQVDLLSEFSLFCGGGGGGGGEREREAVRGQNKERKKEKEKKGVNTVNVASSAICTHQLIRTGYLEKRLCCFFSSVLRPASAFVRT